MSQTDHIARLSKDCSGLCALIREKRYSDEAAG